MLQIFTASLMPWVNQLLAKWLLAVLMVKGGLQGQQLMDHREIMNPHTPSPTLLNVGYSDTVDFTGPFWVQI